MRRSEHHTPPLYFHLPLRVEAGVPIDYINAGSRRAVDNCDEPVLMGMDGINIWIIVSVGILLGGIGFLIVIHSGVASNW
jgi:hypothetical protein